MRYYDRQGQPLNMWKWAELLEDYTYRLIGHEEVGPYVVSTVWLGIDYNFGDEGPPLIFETIIFDTRKHRWIFGRLVRETVEMWRYPTELAALAGHDQAVCWARDPAHV